MGTPVPSEISSIYRFGGFELDARAGELRQNGVKLKLQDQSYQVLVKLLEHPGEIVRREELRSALWHEDTFVDFETGLNTVIKRLRETLGDSADTPKFIETVPRRGYKFVAALERPHSAATTRRIRGSVVAWVGATIIGLSILAVWLVIPLRIPRVTGYTQVTNDGLAKTTGRERILIDGQRLYFQEIENDRFIVGQTLVSGGEVAPVVSPFTSTYLFDISPDASTLLLGGEDAFWTLPLPAGSPHRLGELSGRSATWSPDGREIFFARGSEIYVANRDGSGSRKLVTVTAGPVYWIRTSPDGRRLRFTAYDPKTEDSSSLWEIARDGTNLHPLLPGWHDPPQECCGTWTADAKYYVFQTYSRTGSNDIWLLPEKRWFRARSKPLQITNGPLAFYSPQPSRDGRTLFAIGMKRRSELVRYDPKSGFVPYLGGLPAGHVAFSADGKWVAYTAVSDGTLWRSKVDGTDRLQLTQPPMDVIVPRWSPDGKQIAFSGIASKRPRTSFVISSQGGNPREIVPGAIYSSDPVWSPDGKSVALHLYDFKRSRISIVDLETKKETPLPGADNFFSPRWSPDGRYIAAITLDEKTLMIFDRTTERWTELAKMWIGYPSWSHDGEYLYFDTLGEDPAFYRVCVSNAKLEKLASLKSIQRFWGWLEPWSGLAPDDSLLVQRDISTQEIYALDWQLP